MRFKAQSWKHIVTSMIAFSMAAILLGGCGAQSTPQPTSTETTIPPTATTKPTTIAPTATIQPTDTPIPESTLSPEEDALSIDQVIGQWKMKFLGGGEGDPGLLTLAPDGTWSMDATGGYHEGMNLGFGTFRFEGDLFLLESDYCLVETGPTDNFVPCTATYHITVAKRDGKPAVLRFRAVDDPFGDRKLSLNGKAFPIFSEQ